VQTCVSPPSYLTAPKGSEDKLHPKQGADGGAFHSHPVRTSASSQAKYELYAPRNAPPELKGS
jgi:hypothetical protein